MNTKQIGDKTVAKILAKLLDKEYSVLLPFGDSLRYDLVVEIESKLLRIQCKTGRIKNGTIYFNSSSTEWYKKHKRKNYLKDADLFGVYCQEIEKVYLVPVDDVKTNIGCLRIDDAKNKQMKNIRWAKKYEV